MLLRQALSASVCNVKQAQGSHAACIMLFSFVTYDKRSRAQTYQAQSAIFQNPFFCVLSYLHTESMPLAKVLLFGSLHVWYFMYLWFIILRFLPLLLCLNIMSAEDKDKY